MVQEILLAYTTHVVSFWAIALVYIFMDSYRTCRNRVINSKYIENEDSLYLAAILTIFNQIFVTLPFLLILSSIYTPPAEIENFSNAILKFIIVCIIEELLFYYIHRLLHVSFFFKKIHYIHHEWRITNALSTIHAHPAEHLFLNVFPIFIGPAITGLSFPLVLLWTLISTLNGVSVHSGYDLYPFLDTKFHNIHHVFPSRNFGVFTVLDRIHGTFAQKIR